jgi:hypothetical protein
VNPFPHCDFPNGLGKKQVRQLEEAGWKFSDRGLRVGNGWMWWSENPKGEVEFLLLADPDENPELFIDDSAAPTESTQLDFFGQIL